MLVLSLVESGSAADCTPVSGKIIEALVDGVCRLATMS